MKPGTFHCPTWKQNFYFFVGWKQSDFLLHLKNKWGVDVDPKPQFRGQTITLERNGEERYLIQTEGDPYTPEGAATLAHECLHAALHTLEMRGVNDFGTHQEPLCYLMDTLVQSALEQYRPRKK